LPPDVNAPYDFGWGSAPDPAGELTALPQTPWLDSKGSTFNVKRGKKKKGKG